MELLIAALLGVVQGLTEFLPISSSAHLILARAFTGWNPDRFGLAFDVALHVGTLLAVLVFFRLDLTAMLRAVPGMLGRTTDPPARRLRLVAVGTIPIVIVGGLWNEAAETATRTPVVAATALLIGAGVLLLIERLDGPRRGEWALTAPGALAIGAAQALALIPGVSRSGATIATGMLLGLTREAAARFTFVLSVPAILAAAAKKTLDLRAAGWVGADPVLFAVGMASSAVVGYLTVKYFIRFLATHRLDVFAWYRVALALATFFWLAAG
ncbi:MAG TPA: undecaprenyl-diphosphate phosphatase [Vicinamibacterales bacterium]|nr:undecaprenyl-diphosphate phosphatase [Vicinamibacterales bacterium]